MNKKILNIGVIATLPLVTTSVVSCFGPQGREIKVDISKADEFLTKSTKYPYIQNNDQIGGRSIGIPFFDKRNFFAMKNILKNTIQPNKIFTKTLSSKEEIIDIKSKFLSLNKEISEFIKANNNNNKYIAFYDSKINNSYNVELYELKTPQQSEDFDFFDKEINDSYDFKTSNFLMEDGTKNNGVPLRVAWPLRSIDPIPWKTKFKSFQEQKNFESVWKGFYANRIGSYKTLEDKWQNHKVNLITYPYIDFENKEFKLLVIAFQGGGFEEYDPGTFSKIKIVNPKSMKYKIVTIKNSLPFSKTKSTPTATQEQDFKKSLEYLRSWFIEVFDPKILFGLMDSLVQTIPQIQLMFNEPQKFVEEYSRQLGIEEERHLRGLRKEEKLNLKIFKDFLSPQHFNNIKQNFIDQNFDFSKSTEIMNQLKNFNEYDTTWLHNIKKNNQNILTNILILLKYASKEWSNIK